LPLRATPVTNQKKLIHKGVIKEILSASPKHFLFVPAQNGSKSNEGLIVRQRLYPRQIQPGLFLSFKRLNVQAQKWCKGENHQSSYGITRQKLLGVETLHGPSCAVTNTQSRMT